jgi:beta-lactamase class A
MKNLRACWPSSACRRSWRRASSRFRWSTSPIPALPRYAGVNDHVMMYAASLPKIVAIMAAFERIRRARCYYTPELRQMLPAGCAAVIEFRRLEGDPHGRLREHRADPHQPKYRLYDRWGAGGLWLGKAYGGPNDYWKRDPLTQPVSHGATAYQTARFLPADGPGASW